MKLGVFLKNKDHKKQILIVNNRTHIQPLLRENEQKGNATNNVVLMTLRDIAVQLFIAMMAEKGVMEVPHIINDLEGALLLKSIVQDSQKAAPKTIITNEILSLRTVQELYRKLKLIRANSLKKEGAKSKKIKGFKNIIKAYEDRLDEIGLMDEITLIKVVLSGLKTLDSGEIAGFVQETFNAEFICIEEEAESFSEIEKELLDILLGASQVDGSCKYISVLDPDIDVPNLTNCENKSEFVKAYGTSNEIRACLNVMMQNGYNPGDVTILYTNPAIIPFIDAVFKGNEIPCSFVSGHTAADNEYISLARRCIAWAADNFSETAFEDILKSPVLAVYAGHDDGEDENDKRKNLVNNRHYFDYVLTPRNRRNDKFTLGWGYRRNLEFIEHEKKIADPAMSEMHRCLLECFCEKSMEQNVTPASICNKVIDFVIKYTIIKRAKEEGISGLRKIAHVIEMFDEYMDLDKALSLIDEMLSGIQQFDEVSNNSVKVERFGDDWTVIDRPIVFVTGMALKDMLATSTDLSILSSREMDYLAGGYIPTPEALANKIHRNVLRTISTFSGERITFVYSFIDSVTGHNNNPSLFYLNMLDTYSDLDIDHLPRFEYGNPEEPVLMARTDYKEGFDKCEINPNTSTSLIEMLLECPRGFAYKNVLRIPDNEQVVCNNGEWLDSRNQGIFFHEIAEKYVQKKLIGSSTAIIDENVDEDLINEIAVSTANEMLKSAPAPFSELKDGETKRMIRAAAKHMDYLHNDYRENAWRPMAVELWFQNAELTIKDLNDKQYMFCFSGIIDRIDYRLDNTNKKIRLRIADYKTGEKKYKDEAIKEGKIIQHIIYHQAIMDERTETVISGEKETIKLQDFLRKKISELEAGTTDLKEWDFVFDSFVYEFPRETPNNTTLCISAEDIKKGEGIARLQRLLTAISEQKMFPDRLELNEKPGETIKKKNECRFCKYDDICENRKAGII